MHAIASPVSSRFFFYTALPVGAVSGCFDLSYLFTRGFFLFLTGVFAA